MDNRKKKKNKHKHKNKSNTRPNTQNVIEKNEISEGIAGDGIENLTDEILIDENSIDESTIDGDIAEEDSIESATRMDEDAEYASDLSDEEDEQTTTNSEVINSEVNEILETTYSSDETDEEDNAVKVQTKKDSKPKNGYIKRITELLPENKKETVLKAAKILLPVAACLIIIMVIVSNLGPKKSLLTNDDSSEVDMEAIAHAFGDKPLEENAHDDVNKLMETFLKALADGDMETVKSIKEENTMNELLTYEKKSEFIESYDDINCYTKSGIDDNTYFLYVTYMVKVNGIDTKFPSLSAYYVYPADDGSLKIQVDKNMSEKTLATFQLLTAMDDVVDIYNKIDVGYKTALASDKELAEFLDELQVNLKISVGEELARLEADEASSSLPEQTETQTSADETQTTEAGTEQGEEVPQNKIVNQTVRATDTVNVRSSDSEEADRIGKAQAGTELTRIEERVNGWSKVIFEGKEAFIKSDYLEVVAVAEPADTVTQPDETTAAPIGKVKALTNVNVRSEASQESTKLGTAQAGNSYDLIEDKGEWYKIIYNNGTGFVKAEFFER